MKKRFVQLLIILIVLFAGAEVALRATGLGDPLWIQPDTWTGWRLRPRTTGEQNGVRVTTNADGWRDRSRRTAIQTDTISIAVLGDGFTEGRTVNDDETFTAVAERELASCPALKGGKAEIMNFGVSGFGTAQELLALQEYVWPFDPDVVVLAFSPASDLRDNAPSEEPMKPVATVSGSLLSIDMTFRQSPRFLGKTVWFRSLLDDLTAVSRVAQIVRGAPIDTAPFEDIATDDAFVSPSGELAQLWNVTETLIEAMFAQVKTKDASFLLFTTTQSLQVDPETDKRTTAKDPFYAENRLKKLGGQVGFPVLALAPTLADRAKESGVAYHDDTGSWNAAGHAEAGKELAKALCAGLTPPSAE